MSCCNVQLKVKSIQEQPVWEQTPRKMKPWNVKFANMYSTGFMQNAYLVLHNALCVPSLRNANQVDGIHSSWWNSFQLMSRKYLWFFKFYWCSKSKIQEETDTVGVWERERKDKRGGHKRVKWVERFLENDTSSVLNKGWRMLCYHHVYTFKCAQRSYFVG